MKERNERYGNILISAGVTLFCIIFTLWRYRLHYDMNDDVMLKDILSGVYTGRPEALDIQMLSPLSFVISLMYRLFPSPDWYGIFLLVSVFITMFLMTGRVLSFSGTLPGKILCSVAAALSFIVFGAPHVVFMQYTVISAFLMSTAIFLFCTEETVYLRRVVVRTVLLCGMALCLRPLMAVFLTPFFILAVLYRELLRSGIPIKQKMKEVLPGFLAVSAAFLLLFLVNGISCGGKEWREFRKFFDARTELYDYETIPAWESASAMYSDLGLDRTDVKVIKNYNFGVDDRVDARVLKEIAGYAHSLRRPPFQRFRIALYVYLRQILPGRTYRVENITLLVLYSAVAFSIVILKKYRYLLICPGLFILRSALYLYVIYRERYPDRITFSLFICEAFVLLFLILALRGKQRKERRFTALLYSIICLISLTFLVPVSDGTIREELNDRRFRNAGDTAIKAYCSSHPDIFFFEDVYSTVDFSEELPGGTMGQNPMNCAIMGGWACRSPLWDRKLQAYGITDPYEALLSGKAEFICRLDYDTDWIAEFYAARGQKVRVRRIAGIMGAYGVYRIHVR